jgi:hypothetical protein
VLGKQFQKMRRRLTVTGASENIDGMSKLEPTESQEMKKVKQKKNKVSGFGAITVPVQLLDRPSFFLTRQHRILH